MHVPRVDEGRLHVPVGIADRSPGTPRGPGCRARGGRGSGAFGRLPGPADGPGGGLQAEAGDRLGLPIRPAEGLAPADAPADGLLLGGIHRGVDAGDPVVGPGDRPGVGDRPRGPGRAGGVSRQAAPTPVLGAGDEAGLEGVALDVAASDEEVVVILDGEGLEASLVEVAGTGRVAVGVPGFR
jgi:hypothetical protein